MYELKIKVTENQEKILQTSLKSFATSLIRFSEPSITEGTLTIDPFDFAQLVTYMERNFQDEMEIFRLKKIAVNELVKKQARCRKKTAREAYRQMIEKLEWATPKLNL